MISWNVVRDFGHPWDTNTRKGFDLMEANADSEVELAAFIKQAETKFWKPWLVSNVEAEDGKYGAVLFKPCGIIEFWEDSPKNPHPGIVRNSYN